MAAVEVIISSYYVKQTLTLYVNIIYGLTKVNIPTTQSMVTVSSHMERRRSFARQNLFLDLGNFLRCVDVDTAASVEALAASAKHKGQLSLKITKHVIFNKGSQSLLATLRSCQDAIYLEHGKTMIFGENEMGVCRTLQ